MAIALFQAMKDIALLKAVLAKPVF